MRPSCRSKTLTIPESKSAIMKGLYDAISSLFGYERIGAEFPTADMLSLVYNGCIRWHINPRMSMHV